MGHATYSQLKLEEISEATPLIEDETRTRTIGAGRCWRSWSFSDFARSFETPEASSDKPAFALVSCSLLTGEIFDDSPCRDTVTFEPTLVNQQCVAHGIGQARDRGFIVGFH
jgi:hypothetical protein